MSKTNEQNKQQSNENKNVNENKKEGEVLQHQYEQETSQGQQGQGEQMKIGSGILSIGDMIEEDSKWIRFVSGDKMVLQFDPDQIPGRVNNVYEGKPSLRYEFKVVDVNKGDLEKLWTVSKVVATDLLNYFKDGYFTLKIERKGTGLQTRYQIIPVPTQKGQQATTIAAAAAV